MDRTLLELYDKISDSPQICDRDSPLKDSFKRDEGQKDTGEIPCDHEIAELNEPSRTSENDSDVLFTESESAIEMASEAIQTDTMGDKIDFLVERLSRMAQSFSVLSETVDKIRLQILESQQTQDKMIPSITEMSTVIRGYDEALKALRVSLAANQRNEQILHDKLDAAKKDEHFTTIRPFLEFMILQHMDLTHSKQNYENDKNVIIQENTEGIYQEIISLHENYLLSLENQMAIQGIEIVTYLPGTDYLPLEQNIIGFISTDNPEMDRKLSSLKSLTYKYENKILRKANVLCYKLGG